MFRNRNVTDKLQTLAIALLLAYVFGLYRYIPALLEQNWGLPEPPYMLELTLVLPGIVILIVALRRKSLKLPYFLPFLLVEGLFLFFESPFFRGSTIPVYTYPYSFMLLYYCFVLLVNYGTGDKQVRKIVQLSIYAVILLAGTSFLGYVGVIDMALESREFAVWDLSQTRPLGKVVHINGLSFACCIGIYLVIFQRLWSANTARRYRFLILPFMAVIIINATMGVFIMASIGIIGYLFYTWSRRHPYVNLAILYGLLVTAIVLLLPLGGSWLEKVYLFNRVGEESEFISRFRQIYVTWQNFIDNPWLGVGYYNAARGVLPGYTRSNFHYTQILATNGVVYFGFYLFFLHRLFGIDFKRLEPFLCMVIGFGALMFYNFSLIFPLAIIAYLVYRRREVHEVEPVHAAASALAYARA